MKSYILPLSDPQVNLETAGGKGMSLAKLARAGLSVPDGFHITTDAYREFVESNNLQLGILAALDDVDIALPATLETAARKIGLLFAKAAIPDDLANAIVGAYGALPGSNPAVAVRSSATAEDLPQASFAGQQETYLNITGADKVLEATKKCWASLWTARAIGYRARQRILPEGMALAVVVQLLVNAEAAGVMFTANPLNGKRDEAVINAAWGLGEAIVSGAVTPDTITVNKLTGNLIQRETAAKQVMTIRVDGATEEQAVPNALIKVPVLSDKQATELANTGSKIEELYGMPMDIEWALADGAFFIMQARPITTIRDLPIEWSLPDPKGVYMRASVADLMPEPLSPLFVTLGIPAQVKMMQPLGKRITGSEPVLAKDYLTSINNYAYLNSAFPARGLWWIVTGLIPAYPKLLRVLVPLWRDEIYPEYRAFVASKQNKMPESMSSKELWHEAQELVDAAAYYICGLMFATMGASAGAEGLLTRVYNTWVKKSDDPDVTALLMGWDNIPARSEKSLYDLAMWVREDKILTETILDTPSHELAALLKAPDSAPAALFSEFASRFRLHLEKFGHIIFQLDFAEPLPFDHPEMMLENIKMYLRGEGSNPYERQKASESKRIQISETILNRLKGFKLWAFRKALNWGQSMAEIREDALAEIGLAYPKMRAMLHELGRRFVAAGAIQQVDDIFWLEKEEISAGINKLEHDQALEDMNKRVEKRKSFNERAKQVTPPPMMPVKKRVMGVKSEMFIAQTEQDQAGNVLKGAPTSAGKVTAPARILRGPDDFDQMKPGDVLVAGATTPAWTPLFAMASAVVTDIGGPLSHGSIVAREYGIPAVMGTGVATKRIRSGQVITVDGVKGEVILEAAKGDQAVETLSKEWKVPNPKVTYARGSLAEHIPSPVSPLFATLGLRIANIETFHLWEKFIGSDPSSLFYEDSFYLVINRYVYGGFRLGLKESWMLAKMSFAQMGPMLRGSVPRWESARETFANVVANWEQKNIIALSPSELLDGIRTAFRAAVKYFTVIQTTLPAASSSEVVFSRFYNYLIKRDNDPEFTTLLFGFETLPVRAEKSLFDIAIWLKENPSLAEYACQTPTETLAAQLKQEAPPAGLSEEAWLEWRARFNMHLEKFGRTAYEYDFANPTPAEAPNMQIEAVKQFLNSKMSNPYERYQTAVEKREQATQSLMQRLGWPRKSWFEKLLKWAQETGAIREDFHR